MLFFQRIINLYFKMTKIKTKEIVLFTMVFILFNAFVMYSIEPNTFDNSYLRAVYFIFTTLTTVGYGDYSPSTDLGIIYLITIIYPIGIGIFGVVIGKILEGFTLYRKLKEEGKMSYTKENHIVIIDWTPKTKHAMEEALQADDKIEIVLIDDLEKIPFDHPRVHYIQGYCSNDETLLKANIHKAQAVIIFADKSTNNTELIDGKSLLVATAIERFGKKMGKEIHITAEIVDENHKQNFVNVGVEEFLLGNETIARLAIRSAFSKGISTIYNKLISNEGEDLYEVPNQNWEIYREAFIALLEEGATLISSDGNLDIAERLNETIPPNAKLRVVCKDETYNRLKNKFNF